MAISDARAASKFACRIETFPALPYPTNHMATFKDVSRARVEFPKEEVSE